MPSLDVYQSLWAMELRRPDGVERSHDEAFEMTAAAGYAGMALDLGASDMATAKTTQNLFRTHNLSASSTRFQRPLKGSNRFSIWRAILMQRW